MGGHLNDLIDKGGGSNLHDKTNKESKKLLMDLIRKFHTINNPGLAQDNDDLFKLSVDEVE